MSESIALQAVEPAPVVFRSLRKRNKSLAPFDAGKITDAILKAANATGEFGKPEAKRLTIRVLSLAQAVIDDEVPEVEELQDLVEEVLLASPYKKTA
ncbi:MAG: ATP cone domain-containing protein, partial [Desulfobulbales bacterium]